MYVLCVYAENGEMLVFLSFPPFLPVYMGGKRKNINFHWDTGTSKGKNISLTILRFFLLF